MRGHTRISRRTFGAGAAATLAARGTGAAERGREPVIAFTGGLWFDGNGFSPAQFFAVNGVLTTARPPRVEQTIALNGKYIVPPFGEAHNHNVEAGSNIDAVLLRYLRDGVFYVKNPCNVRETKVALAGKINAAARVDAVFANGCITVSGGHPIGLADRNLRRTGSPVWREGGFYHTVDTDADLAGKWDHILAGRPDFIKCILQFSEEHAKRKDDPAFFDWRGLDPALLPRITERAHAAGLRISAHVESATDFHNALAAGVDEINHMPGFRPDRGDWSAYDGARFKIAEADAALAAQRRVVVVTTLVGAITRLQAPQPGDRSDELQSALVHNLQLLMKHGVPVAVGSDSYGQTSQAEAAALHNLGIDNRTLLKMWCETTPAAIFPGRRIGALREGFEASFLVLAGNPLEDFANVGRIEARLKQGALLPALA